MRFDDRAADRQPHAHTAGLDGEERIEQPIQKARGDADAGVAHRHGDVPGLVRVRGDRQHRPLAHGRRSELLPANCVSRGAITDSQ